MYVCEHLSVNRCVRVVVMQYILQIASHHRRIDYCLILVVEEISFNKLMK